MLKFHFAMKIALPLCLAGWLGLSGSAAHSQGYPTKPVRIITAEQGGGADIPLRLIVPGLSELLGQQLVVENRGGSVTIPASAAAKAGADGYTLLFYGSPLWLVPFLQEDVPFDPVKDFAPITLATRTANVLVVHPSVAANSVRELLALAKAKPGVLNFGAGGTGSSSHLGPELLKAMTGVNIVRVPYKGAGPAIIALVSGEVQMMITNAGSVMPHVKAGKLKVLAVTSATPSALLPGLATVAASVPDYESSVSYGLFAPARTPDAIIRRLNQDLVKVLNRPELKERFLSVGTEVVGNSPEQLAAVIHSEMTRMGKVIKDAGIRAE